MINKVNFGKNFLRCFIQKYFKDEDAMEILQHDDEKLIDIIKDIQSSIQNSKNNDHIIETELDENALVKSNKYYRKIEFLGFSDVWKKIMDVENLTHITLFNEGMNSFGKFNELPILFSKVIQLSLEINLISSWSDMLQLSHLLPNLEILDLNFNFLHFDFEIENYKNHFDNLTQNTQKEIKTSFPSSLPNLSTLNFNKLRILSLKSCNMNFERLSLLKDSLPNIEELGLSKNFCTDFNNLKINPETDFCKLRMLDLSENQISNFDALNKLSLFKNLEILNLTQNKLSCVEQLACLNNLQSLNMERNELNDLNFVQFLCKFENLKNLRISGNLVLEKFGDVHVKYVCIASLNKIEIMNGTKLKPFEIKDCRIYYWKNTFHEFFEKFDCNHKNFIFSEYLHWAKGMYPKIIQYIQDYEVPYESIHQPDYQSILYLDNNALIAQTQAIKENLENIKIKKTISSKVDKNTNKIEMLDFLNNSYSNKDKKNMFCEMCFEYNGSNLVKKIPFKVPFNFIFTFIHKKLKVPKSNNLELKFYYNGNNGVDNIVVKMNQGAVKVDQLISWTKCFVICEETAS